MITDSTNRPTIHYMKFSAEEVDELRTFLVRELEQPISKTDWSMVCVLVKKLLSLIAKGEVDLIHVRSKMPKGARKFRLKNK